MANELEGKAAVVTGGTRGIGFAVAAALLAEGASIFICGREAAHVDSATRELAAKGVRDRVAGVVGDVRRFQDCRRLIRGAAERFGGLDILVNNAGIGILKPVDELSPEEWDATIQTNLSAAFYCSHEAIPFMRRRGGGYIINISSLAGINALPRGSAYNASKFGLNGLSEAMMQDVRYDKIRVSYIMPGSVDTDFASIVGTKAREAWKLATEDVAKAVIDLCKFPDRALVSRIEMRPSRPPRKQ